MPRGGGGGMRKSLTCACFGQRHRASVLLPPLAISRHSNRLRGSEHGSHQHPTALKLTNTCSFTSKIINTSFPTMTQAKPTVIFVPGAWHGPQVFDPVANILQSQGYKTVAVSLPSVGASPPLNDFQPDVTAIREAIQCSINEGSEVIVFAHSYGGVPSSEAIKGLTKSDLQSQGKPGGVIHYMLCAAFLIPEGVAPIDPEKGPSPQYELLDDATIVMPIDAVETFYADLPRETAERYAAALKRQSYKVFASKLTYAAWRHVPTTYLYTENDSALPILYQKMMVEGSGVEVKTETFAAGHSVFLTLPGRIAESVRRAAGESV